MKGFFTVLLMFASTGMVYAQQSQNDFTSSQSGQRDSFAPQSGSATKSTPSPQSNSAVRTNQTRLAALQSDSRIDRDSENHVIMPDGFDFPQENDRQRSFIGPENNPSNRNANNRNPNNRNAIQEPPRFSAQSSERSATSVLPSRNNRGQNTNFQSARNGNNQATNIRNVSSQSRPVSSIYDLQITPALQDELKQYGYLFAKLNTEEARSDQVRLFGDTQRARNGNSESKIFSSRVSDYQGNLVIDIDDNALQRIAEGSYTLDDFDRYQARGVVLRYVTRNNERVDLSRVDLGQTGNSNAAPDYSRRDVVDNRQSDRGFSNSNSNYRNRNRNRDSDGDWVLPNSGRSQRDRLGDRGRDFGSSRTVGSRDSRDSRYSTSSTRRNYQDRMSDIYSDDTVRSRDRLVDRRNDWRQEDVTYDNRRTESRLLRDEIDDGRRELEEGFAELSQWQRDLARQTREIEDERRQLDRMEARTDTYSSRYKTAGNQSRQNPEADLLDRLRDYYRSPLVNDRYADSRNSNQNNSTQPYLGSYATQATLTDPNDPRFSSYAKNNLDQVARLNQKFAAMQQANELAALENKVDNEYQKQQLQLAQSKLNGSGRTVKTFIDDGEVLSTLGGNMAAGRGGYVGDRYAANFRNSYPNNGGVADMSMRSSRQNFGSDRSQQTANSGASDKLVRALWFIALLSIGMNMYLALLARSFYSRYNELADELRETFTSSSVDYSSPSRSARPRREHDTVSARPRRERETVNPIPPRTT